MSDNALGDNATLISSTSTEPTTCVMTAAGNGDQGIAHHLEQAGGKLDHGHDEPQQELLGERGGRREKIVPGQDDGRAITTRHMPSAFDRRIVISMASSASGAEGDGLRRLL